MKKAIAISMALVLIVALAACGSPAPAAPAASGAAPAASNAPAASSAPAATPAPEKSSITVEVFDRGTDGGKTDPANNYYSNWIKDKVLADENIDVTFVKVSRWEETDKLNALMAASDAPDVCITYSADLIANYRDLGGLVNLEPYIDTLLPDLRDFLGEDTAVPGKLLINRHKLNENGHVYQIPARRIVTAGTSTFIRKDWLDKLGLGLPTSTEEYHEALKAFKAQDPGGVGSANVVPFTLTSDAQWRSNAILYSFIDPNTSPKDRWINTVVDRPFLLPGYKEGVRFMNQMYNEGLIDPEFPLYNDDVTSDNLIKSGVVGSFIHNWDYAYRESPGLYKELEANVPGASYVTIDPFKNYGDKTMKFEYDPAGVSFFVPIFSKNPEAALRYVNWLSKVENRYFLQIGNEGVTHNMVNGVPQLITTEGPEIMNSSQNIDYTIMINGLDTGDPVKNLEALANSYAVAPELIMEAYENSMRDASPILVVPGLTLSAAGPYTQTLQDKGKSLLAESITCKPDQFDAKWDAGIADWLGSGAQAVIDERAAKYYE